MNKYNPQKIEPKWQKQWGKDDLYTRPPSSSPFVKEEEEKEKYYILDMFPYPSGDGLHMGHTESYTASDIIYRYKKLQDFDVLHPQGFDSFGLPAENYAIKTGTHPKEITKVNSDNYIKQMKMLGLGHDLSHLVYTSDPSYYKWTQFLFGKFFENNIVERKTDTINWCPSCNTGIANEQVEDGKCERCKASIEQKEIPGWFFKITDFADDLIDDLDKVDWPEATKKNQRAWIGKSEGAKLVFKVKSQKSKVDEGLEVFTTRPDTLFGATYMVVAPEHPLISSLSSPASEAREGDPEVIKNYDEVLEYVKGAKNKTEMERLESKEKTGVELKGIKAINPANGEEIPVFVADYVLGGYGTGAIMAVPAHDERDYEFAIKYNIPIKQVIAPKIQITLEESFELFDEKDVDRYNIKKVDDKAISCLNDINLANELLNKVSCNKIVEGISQTVLEDWLSERKIFTDKGVLVNSGKFNDMTSDEAKIAITKEVGGELTSNYRLRDWSISRQRYWGCPIPIVYSPEGEAKFVGEENLPWTLPEDVDFVPTGESPLAKSEELKKRVEKLFGKGWTPEVDTMDTFVDSSWYFLRYPDTENDKEFCSADKLKRWLPVDLYIGGAEHTYMHLLYARFFVKAMKKIGLVEFDEPFIKLRHQGMVLDSKGKKMSKSKGNVINPNDMVERFGADAVRMYMMFAGPLEDDVMFKEDGVTGVYRFLEKVWKIFNEKELLDCGGNCEEIDKSIPPLFHKTIKKVTEDIENLSFNTAISAMMIFANACLRQDKLPQSAMKNFLILLSPFAPHIAEELWEKMGDKKSIFLSSWPEYNKQMIIDEKVKIAVQVNGKVRDTIEIEADTSEEEVKKIALESKKVQKWIDDKDIKKIIYVKGKLISVVV